MGEKYFVERQNCRTVNSKGFSISDSVLFLGKIAEYPRSVTSWKGKIEWVTQSPEYRELDGVYGEPVVFEWKSFPRYTSPVLLQEIQRNIEEIKFCLEERITFMSMYNDIDWEK